MKKKSIYPQKLRKRIRELCQLHAWNIGVSHFEVAICYMNEDKAPADNDYTEKDVVAGEMVVNRRYLTATMNIYPTVVKNWKKEGDRFLREVVSHEIAHLATEHFKEVAMSRYCDEGEMKDAWETCTTTIGNLSAELDWYKQKYKPKK